MNKLSARLLSPSFFLSPKYLKCGYDTSKNKTHNYISEERYLLGHFHSVPYPYLAGVRLSRSWTQALGADAIGIELLEGSDGAQSSVRGEVGKWGT